MQLRVEKYTLDPKSYLLYNTSLTSEYYTMSICLRFVDDFGNEVFPCRMPYVVYMRRYCFYKDDYYQ